MEEMWSRYQQVQERVHMHRALAELRAMLEYAFCEGDEQHQKAQQAFQDKVEEFISWLVDEALLA